MKREKIQAIKGRLDEQFLAISGPRLGDFSFFVKTCLKRSGVRNKNLTTQKTKFRKGLLQIQRLPVVFLLRYALP